MSDLSPETRRLIEMAREGDPIPSGRRALIESKLFTRVAGGALVGLAAREAWAKSTGLFGPLAKGLMGLAIVSSVGAGGYFAVRASGNDAAITHSSSGAAAKAAPRPVEVAPPMAAAMLAPSEAAPPANPVAGSSEPVHAAAASPAPREATTRRVAASAKVSGASSRSAGTGQHAQTSSSRSAATTAVQPAQQAQTAQNTAPPPAPAEQPAAQPPPEEATPARPPSTLADETRLLWEADQALRAGKTTRAVALLDEHMTRYPEGALGPERGAERVVALCKLGRIDAATVRGYLTSHPNLPLSDRIQQTCAPILSRSK